MRSITIAAILFVATTLLAAPTVTSITPPHGVAGGGTKVTITGTGFAHCPVCSPPLGQTVLFGTTPSPSVTMLSETTIEAVTPPHVAGTVSVTVMQWDGQATLPAAFTFTGDMFAGLEPILLPVFSPPVRGAHGSEFHTTASVSHRGGSAPVLLFGVVPDCVTVLPIEAPSDPREIGPDGMSQEISTACATGPARLLWVPAGKGDALAFSLRVRDVSRSALSHGAEIPVARADDFTTGSIVLPTVPLDPLFRNTLRIYALEPTEVEVTVGFRRFTVALQPGRSEFEPYYAVFTDFPADQGPAARVDVKPLTPITSPPSRTIPIWAFLSVTNNETQEITTVSPN